MSFKASTEILNLQNDNKAVWGSLVDNDSSNSLFRGESDYLSTR